VISTPKPSSAVLVLADGRAFYGRAFGAQGTAIGPLHFHTEQTGYPEAITASDNSGSVLAFTAPHIGNTGIEDPEAATTATGVVLRDPSRIASHWDAKEDFEPYLKRHNVVTITHVDTRALIRHAGVHHRESAGPIYAGIFSGEEAASNLKDLISLVNETSQKGL